MAAQLSPISVTDSSGTTASIEAGSSRELLMFKVTGNRVWISYSPDAAVDTGIYIDVGQTVTLDGSVAKFPVYMVCDSGLTATVYAVEKIRESLG